MHHHKPAVLRKVTVPKRSKCRTRLHFQQLCAQRCAESIVCLLVRGCSYARCVSEMQIQAGTVLALTGPAIPCHFQEHSDHLASSLQAQDLIGMHYSSAASMLIAGGTKLGRSQLTKLSPHGSKSDACTAPHQPWQAFQSGEGCLAVTMGSCERHQGTLEWWTYPEAEIGKGKQVGGESARQFTTQRASAGIHGHRQLLHCTV